MIGSIFLYVALLAECIYLAKRAQDTQKKRYVWLIVAILSVFVGIRGSSVGIDTAKYMENFGHIARGNAHLVFGAERTFVKIVQILQFFSKSPVFVFLVFAFLTNGLILFRLWEFRGRIAFVWAFIYFYACFYFFEFNIVRQMVAIAIVFWGTRFVQKEQYVLFLACVVAAFLFHQSALLGVLYLGVDFLQKEKWTRHKVLFTAFLCAGILGGGFFLLKASKYLHYFKNIKMDIGFLIPLKISFLALYIVLLKQLSGHWLGRKIKGRYEYINTFVVIYYGVGLFITLLGYFFSFMDRIGLYFTVCGCVFMGHLAKRTRYPLMLRIIFAVIIGIPFAMDLLSGGQGQLPYKFFWQP